jgi:tetratricopeptide (TPR) repeat protein
MLVAGMLGVLVLGGWLLWRPCLAEYHLAVARRAVARCQNLRAEEHLQRCLQLRPADPRALLLAARVARRVAQFDVAEQALDHYQDLRGADDHLVLERVLLRASRGNVDEVRPFCKARIDEEHPTADLVREAVVAGLIQGYRLQEASIHLRDWLQRDPDCTPALLLDGSVQELHLDLAAAQASFGRVVDLDPDHDDARLRLVSILLQNSNAPEALPHVEHLRRSLPGNPSVDIALAKCQDLLGQQEEAKATLDDLLHRQPENAAALAERGRLALRARDLLRAEMLLRDAVQRNPASLDTRYLLVQALRLAGKDEQARTEQEALSEHDRSAARIQKIATMLMQQRPADPDLHCEVGVISLRAGGVREGLRWLYRALEIDPRHAEAHRALADFYQRTGNSTLALRHRQAVEVGK